MAGADRVSRAEARVRAARGRFDRTFATLQDRLNPGRIAHDAWEGAKEKSQEIAEGAVEVVTKRPALTGLAAAGIVAFFARARIAGAVRTLFKRDSRRDRRRARAGEPTQGDY